jgi:hypothetical protein
MVEVSLTPRPRIVYTYIPHFSNNPFRQKIRDPQKEDHKKIWLPEDIYVYLSVNEIITTVMETGSITKELKKTIEGMDLPLIYEGRKYRWTFTDYYKTKDPNKKQASVKFVGLYLSEENKDVLRLEMEKKGFKFEFLKESYPPPHPYFQDSIYGNWGTKICFSKAQI